MKKTAATLSLLLLTSLAITCPSQADTNPPCPIEGNWIFKSEYSDEFNGTEIDAEKWWDFNPSWHGRKPAFFSRDNVTVHDGKLCLTARVQNPEDVTVENRIRGYDKFTTAIVKSKKRIRYGYLEVRAKSMRASVCNAFWLYDPLDDHAKYRHGSFSEEIDIFEVFGKPTLATYDRAYCMNVHRFHTPYVESIANHKVDLLPNKQMHLRVPFDFWADFHTYGFLWTRQQMVWFIDGKEVFRRENDYFTTCLHIMLDCEIMQGWVGLPDPADLPATFEIDYLRVWQDAERAPFPMAPGFEE